jgi:copper chaperone CopZ
MKKTLVILVVLLMTTLVSAKTEQVVMKAEIDCINCKKKIMKNIAYEDGVEDLKVILPKQMVAVKFDSEETNALKIAQAVTKLGYEVSEYVLNGKKKVFMKNGKVVKKPSTCCPSHKHEHGHDHKHEKGACCK